MMTKLLKTTVIILSLITVTACSSSKKNANSDVTSSGYVGGGAGGEAVTTAGIGEDGKMIGGYGTSEAYRLKGGANQIYFFDYDQSLVHDKYIPSINAQANYMVTHPNAKVLLTGNTDARGSDEYNIALGNRRAWAVANQLKAQGINAAHFRVLSYGSKKPISSGTTSLAYALNRNVQLIFEGK
jgi:peptidoglycan-associated lipoprotein